MKLLNNKDFLYRIIASLSALVIITFCVIITEFNNIETTSLKIFGSYASVILIIIALYKFPIRFYILTMIFDIFATALGSVINLYNSIGFYDRFVHYLSGILIADGGIIIIKYLFKKKNIKNDFAIFSLFSFFFSSACAGFWEIYEFTCDQLIKTNMQGDNLNTMGDIVSGVLGALTYFIIMVFINLHKIQNDKKRNTKV